MQISARFVLTPETRKKTPRNAKNGRATAFFRRYAPVAAASAAVPRRCNEAQPALPLSVSEGCGRVRSLHTRGAIKDVYMHIYVYMTEKDTI